jgi:hypothetical protein
LSDSRHNALISGRHCGRDCGATDARISLDVVVGCAPDLEPQIDAFECEFGIPRCPQPINHFNIFPIVDMTPHRRRGASLSAAILR